MTPTPRLPLVVPGSVFSVDGPHPAPPPAPRRVFVSRRVWAGLQRRPQKVPHSAQDGARLRKAELKRRRKAAQRLLRLPHVDAATPSPEGTP